MDIGHTKKEIKMLVQARWSEASKPNEEQNECNERNLAETTTVVSEAMQTSLVSFFNNLVVSSSCHSLSEYSA